MMKGDGRKRRLKVNMGNMKKEIWERLGEKLFDKLVWSVFSYEMKVWGWKERERGQKNYKIDF